MNSDKLVRASVVSAVAAVAFGLNVASRAATYTFIPYVQNSGTSNTPAPSATGSADWNTLSWVTQGGSTFPSSAQNGLPGSGDIAADATGATAVISSGESFTVNDVRWANFDTNPVATANGVQYAPAQSGGTANADGTLEIDAGGTLTTVASSGGTVNGNVIIGNTQPSRGTLFINGGTLNVGGASVTTSSADGTTANQPYVGSLVIGNTTKTTGAPNATFLIHGGSVNVANNFSLGNGYSAPGSGTSAQPAIGTGTQTGGDVEVAGAIFVGSKGQGTYTISAGTLNQNGTNGDGSAAGRDAFYVGQQNAGGTGSGVGTFTQSGTASVGIANGLYIANGSNTTGKYIVQGGSLTVHGSINVGATQAAGIGTAAATTASGNVGELDIVGNSASTIYAGSLNANGSSSTLAFTIGSAAGSTLLDLTSAYGGDGSANFASATNIDLFSQSGFTPTAGEQFTLLTASSINGRPTLSATDAAFSNASLSIVGTPGNESLVATIAGGSAVPEPASAAVLLLGSAVAAGRRHRRPQA